MVRPDSGSSGDDDPTDLGSQLRARRADFERHVQSTRAQLDATNERIAARVGRNLVLAIGIGLAVGALFLFSLIVVKQIFVLFAIAMVCFGSFELAGALRAAGRHVPLIPTVVGAGALMPLAYLFGSAGAWWGVLGAIAFVWLWRLGSLVAPRWRAGAGSLARDLAAAAFVQFYVSLLAAFTVLLVREEGGQWWTLAFIIVVAAADTGAYASGLAFGRHPMAPRISPKKTWEGFAGAFVASVVAGVLLAAFMLGQPWWFGLIFGVCMLLSATAGDLAESLIKRDLGVKDMSSWLPGHGGFLDRLDSILPSALVAYALFLAVA